jgi:tripartite-type tricarboxylate transporter receptor subunit TctC
VAASVAAALVLSVGGLAPLDASAQPTWPDRPVRVVVPFPPGGPSDIVLRAAAERMQAELKQPIVIDNKAGAGGNLGASEVARAAPDGHTWLWGTDTIATVNPHVYKSMGFKVDEMVPVSLAVRFGQVLVCNPKVEVKTLDALVTKAKANPMSYASGGMGVPGHLSMELLLHVAGFSMQHVPYKGPAPAMQDVIAGQVACGFLAGPTVLPHIKAGTLVALVASGSQRSPQLPDVPSLAELGLKDAIADFALVLWAPKGTPAPIVGRMRDALVGALKAGDVSDRIKATDMVVVGSPSAETIALLAADGRKWGAVARRLQLGLD